MTRIGRLLTEAIKVRRIAQQYGRNWSLKNDYNIHKLSLSLSRTAEQTRRYVRGEQLPDHTQLRLICKRLNIPWTEAVDLLMLDRMQRQINHSPISEYPGLQVICMLWPGLSENARDYLVKTAHGMSKAKKTMAAAG